jgi:glycosyltransferase involved in cell wall biosynthesis
LNKVNRTLHVVASMHPRTGGIYQAIQTLIKGVSVLGVCNEVVSLDDDLPSMDTQSFPVHTLGPGKWGLAYSSKLIPWLVDNLFRFDSIIIHGLWQYHSIAVWKALKIFQRQQKKTTENVKESPRVFIMPHGMLDPYFQRATERRFKALRNWIYWKLFESIGINRADALFFTCEDERVLAHQTFRPYFPKREIVVGLGIEKPPPFSAKMREAFLERCPQVEGNNYILFLSRIDRKKGVDILIRAYKSFLQKVKSETEGTLDEFPRLIVAGPGMETAYGKSIRNLVSSNSDLMANVFFPGMLQDDVKWGAFYGCNAFILPSHQENFGIAVVEALACSKPVLISQQVNIWREIEDAGGGLVEADTIEGTQELLDRWYFMGKEAKDEMSLNAYESYQNSFTVTKCISRLYNAITF